MNPATRHDGKSPVKPVPFGSPAAGPAGRLGFLEGQISVPDDFDAMGGEEIARLFGLGNERGDIITLPQQCQR